MDASGSPVGITRLPSDRAMTQLAHDRLERRPFVDALVQTIRRAPRDGYTIALTAPWGDGKTSVINFVAEAVDARGDAQVVRFNPWWFPDGSDIVLRFFGEIAGQLRLNGRIGGEQAAEHLMRFGNALDFADQAGVPFVGLGARASRGASSALRAGKLSVQSLKDDLEDGLTRLDRPVLVVIDDLDRLTPAEIKEVVRLVRSVGELPNITYLLGFDPGPVAKALGPNGEQALEKIIQARFDLPAPRRALIDAEFDSAINLCFETARSERFSAEVWGAMEFEGVRRLIRNLRDVYRLAGALTATLARLGDEVETADVLVLEIIRLQEPAAFRAILAAAEPLTGVTTAAQRLMQGNATDPLELAKVTKIESSAIDSKTVSGLVGQLFPGAGPYLGRGGFGAGYSSIWRRDGRVAHADKLDAYLHRGIAEGTPSHAKVLQALAALNDPTQLALLLARPDSEVMVLLPLVEDHLSVTTLTNPGATVATLLRAAWSRREPRTFKFERTVGITLEVFTRRLMAALGRETVEGFIRDIRCPDLSSQADLAKWAGRETQTGDSLVAPEVAESMERDLANAVLDAAPAALLGEPDLPHLLWRTEQLDPAAFRLQLVRWIENDQFFGAWLAGCSNIRGGDRAELDWTSVTRSLDERVVHKRLARLDITSLDERSQLAVRQAQEQLNQADAGTDKSGSGLKYDRRAR